MRKFLKNKFIFTINHYLNMIFGVILKGIFIRNNPRRQHMIKKKFLKFLNNKNFEYFSLDIKSDIILFTIAFNNPHLVAKQIINLKRNLADNFYHIIVDNGNNKRYSEQTKQVCLKLNTGYIKLPENSLTYSDNHGAAITYTYKHFIQNNKKISYFGFLDQDIFPIKKTSILNHLKRQDIYGLLMDKESGVGIVSNFRGKRWFLWAGFCFYKNIYDNLNFMPNKTYLPLSILDTGGSNRKGIYSTLNKKNLSLEKFTLIKDTYQEKIYTYRLFGDRIHYGGGLKDPNKELYLDKKYNLL